MSKYIVLYNFNKYYNRKIKRLATFADYEALITPGENTPAQYKGFKREFRNFDISDGVYAKHVINIGKNEPLAFKSEQPDYFVLEQSYLDGEDTVTKVSRWFVLECVRTRGNQYELSLRRDLLADYYSEVMTAPVFIERGSPQLFSDPAIFNKEGFTFNQIKKYELLLNSNSLSGKGAGWVVGYLNREDTPTALGPCSCSQDLNQIDVIDYDDLPAKVKQLLNDGGGVLNDTNTAYITIPYSVVVFEESQPRFGYITFNYKNSPYNYNLYASNTYGNGAYLSFCYQYYYQAPTNQGVLNYVRQEIGNVYPVVNAFQEYINSLNRQYDFDRSIMDEYNNRVYKRNGKYYQIKFNLGAYHLSPITKTYKGSQIVTSSDNIAFEAGKLIRYFFNLEDVRENPFWDQNKISFSISRDLTEYEVVSEEVDSDSFEVTIPSTRNKLLDSPYDMFVMPIGAVNVKNASGHSNFETQINTALAAARGIAAKGSSTRVLDIQVLPYCPFPEIIDSQGDIDLIQAEAGVDYTIITKTLGSQSIDIGVILYPLRSKGTFTYNLYTLDFLSNPHGYSQEDFDFLMETFLESDNIMIKKIASETRLIRFVSPDFSAIYDINPQKNGYDGIMNINIDYYYKPYTPYIHVKPDFNGLYGVETNDPKGLICSGDFSIATASSKWEEYQVQNKNFENIFDRQIKNLDVNNSIALERQKITGALGIASAGLQGAAAGAVSGGMTGNPFVAAAGAVVGAVSSTVTSAVGFAKDMEFLKRSQTEARSYQVDMYTYQLGNIQALPNTLNRVSAFTPNNKIFPFIEVYDCTDEEKEALRNKIKYNGMTIMRIGHIEDYINSDVTYYVQGQLIRLEGIEEDSHVIAEIANEIKEGAYYYGSDTSES